MPKQTIEIDVPEGMDISEIGFTSTPAVVIHFKKKEPEFIEIRTYLYKNSTGIVPASICASDGRYRTPSKIESEPDFHSWVDLNWRKVKI